MKFKKFFITLTAAVMCLTISSCVGDKDVQVPEEKAEMYFSGQRPAKETSEIIQNRVQNYLDENR